MIFAPQVCRTELKKTEIGELMADINGKETWLGFGEMENGDRIRKWKFCHEGLHFCCNKKKRHRLSFSLILYS
jgi:NOL1/NOP2/fmu family ribosome biogenesis protein